MKQILLIGVFVIPAVVICYDVFTLAREKKFLFMGKTYEFKKRNLIAFVFWASYRAVVLFILVYIYGAIEI